MDMKVDAKRVRSERERRAWSQEHLAQVTGLGLRTIQRIEASGLASYESVKAIASVFALTVSDLHVQSASASELAVERPQAQKISSRARKLMLLLPGIALAVGVLGGTSAVKALPHAFWFVGPLLLASSIVTARALGNLVSSRGSAGMKFAFFLAAVSFLTCAFVAYVDPAELGLMIALLGGGAVITVNAPSRCARPGTGRPTTA